MKRPQKNRDANRKLHAAFIEEIKTMGVRAQEFTTPMEAVKYLQSEMQRITKKYDALRAALKKDKELNDELSNELNQEFPHGFPYE
jgi:hypothetical protein